MLGDSVRRRQKTRATRSSAGKSSGVRRRRWPWVLAAALLPAVIGYALAALVLFPPTEQAAALEGGVPVPALQGMIVGDAERALAAVGLGAGDVMELPHPTAPAGQIIAQDPLAGQHLNPGARVRVAVSSGRPRVRVPDLVGFPLERARALLQRLGFEVTSSERESSEPTGRVIDVSPPPGSEQELPATVALIVSIGLPADTLTVSPDSMLLPQDTLGR